MHSDNGVIKFKKSKEGLYYYNFPKEYKEGIKQSGVQLLDTVAKNRKNYSSQQFEKAKRARKLCQEF